MLRTAYSQGVQLIFLGSADHMAGLERALSGQALSCTPYTCARAVLEACAAGMWLLDPGIDAKMRITRSLNYRLENICLTEKLRKRIELRADASEQGWLAQNPATATADRIKHLRDTARRLGIQPRFDRNNRFLDFEPGIPKISERISSVFGSEADYAILSLVAHANQTGLLQLSGRAVRTADGAVLIPEMDPSHAVWLSCNVVEWHSQAVWAHLLLLGRGLPRAQAVFEDIYELLGLRRALWFWSRTTRRAR